MAERRTHEVLVEEQFGAQAKAYLDSAVHSQGPDLLALASLVRGSSEARVLDLGCGAGHVAFNIAPHVAQVVAYDLSPKMLEVVRASAIERGLGNVVVQQGAAERLPFQDDSFDFVLSRYSAHHWLDLDAGLREAARVLKRGGAAAFVDTVSPGRPVLDTFIQSLELLRDPSHVRNYSRPEWEAALVRADFVLGGVTPYKIRLEFASWVQRMRSPPVMVSAIRALQEAVSASIKHHFQIGSDGSFDLDVAIFHATKRAGQRND